MSGLLENVDTFKISYSKLLSAYKYKVRIIDFKINY